MPSAQSGAADAGIFQVGQVSLFSAAADFLLARTATTQAAEPAATALPAASLQAASAENNGNSANGVSTALAASANANGAANGAASTAATATIADNVQTELASLNAALVTLGLSQAEITVVDRIAQLIKDFNPAAYSDIVNQLQTLAQATAPRTAAVNNGAAAATTPPANGVAPNGTNGTTAQFTLQSVSVQFGERNSAQRPGNGRHLGNGPAQFSAFQVQIQAVTLTLNNAETGASTKIQAPQDAASANIIAAPARAAAAAS